MHKASSSLSALNEFSTVKWADLSPKFDAHTKLIKELQTDLDHVFRKIRTIKAKLNLPNLDDDEEDGDGAEEEAEGGESRNTGDESGGREQEGQDTLAQHRE